MKTNPVPRSPCKEDKESKKCYRVRPVSSPLNNPAQMITYVNGNVWLQENTGLEKEEEG